MQAKKSYAKHLHLKHVLFMLVVTCATRILNCWQARSLAKRDAIFLDLPVVPGIVGVIGNCGGIFCRCNYLPEGTLPDDSEIAIKLFFLTESFEIKREQRNKHY